jgi:hypothetical protein
VTGGIGTLVPVRTKQSILAVCGVLFLVGACSSGGGAAPVVFVEKSAAIANGDAVCKQLTTDVQQLVTAFKSAHPSPSATDAREFFVNTLLPRLDRGVGDLHRVGEPTKDKVGFDDAILSLDKDLSALKTAVAADPVKVAGDKIALFANSAHLFTDYGFKECGKN